MPQGPLALDIDISIDAKDLFLIDVLKFTELVGLRWWYICLHLNYYKLLKLSNNFVNRVEVIYFSLRQEAIYYLGDTCK